MEKLERRRRRRKLGRGCNPRMREEEMGLEPIRKEREREGERGERFSEHEANKFWE